MYKMRFDKNFHQNKTWLVLCATFCELIPGAKPNLISILHVNRTVNCRFA